VLAWPERRRTFAARNERECQTSCLLCGELGVPLALWLFLLHTTCLVASCSKGGQRGSEHKVSAAAVGDAPAQGDGRLSAG
jgi:hypothetical protein